jgi:hypothetical protein
VVVPASWVTRSAHCYEDGRKGARNMLRKYLNINKSPIVASSWSRLHLRFKDARSLKHKINLGTNGSVGFIIKKFVTMHVTSHERKKPY